MQVDAETSVRDVIQHYGKSICDTPKMLETLLRQQGKASPNEVQALVSAVRHNVVKRIMLDPTPNLQALTQILSTQGKQPALVAKWAVETWVNVLSGAAPDDVTPRWNDIETPPGVGGGSTSIAKKALLGLALVALAGLIGGAGPGVWLGYRMMMHDPIVQQALPSAALKDIKDPQQFMLMYGTLGGFAGLVGASVGWMFGGHTRMTPGRVLGAMIGALQASANGAFYGMANGEGAGTFIGCLLLAGIGTYIATLLGVFVVLIFLGQLAKLIFII